MPQGRDTMANLGLVALGIILSVGVVLRGAGSVAAFATGHTQPTGGAFTGVLVVFHPSDPGEVIGAAGLDTVAYWVTAVLLLGLAAW
ncbi:MAG: type VI secretion protein, partial [Propionibacteriaceae bacterium]|nr:type VI secretion protein [Propionibacteriaceae bacterium]